MSVNATLSGVGALSAGKHTCAINASSHLLCWGLNSDGQLGECCAIRSFRSSLELGELVNRISVLLKMARSNASIAIGS